MASRPRQLRWAEAASRDLEEIVTYLTGESPPAAERILARIEALTESVHRFCRMGRVVRELALHGIRRWREVIVRPYRIVYRTGDDQVEIVAVLDGRRDLEDLLLNRLVRSGR